jgi:hypothetical protein
MATEKLTITARGPVERMGDRQFNVLEYDTERYLGELKQAGCGIKPDWNGSKPLRVTISRKEWVSQLNPGDVVEYVQRPVWRKDKHSPTGFKIGTAGIAVHIITRCRPNRVAE